MSRHETPDVDSVRRFGATEIAVDGLSKAFSAGSGTTQALDRISLTVEPGEFVSLLGPSGCGKTTLLRMMAGLIVPDDGTVAIGGETVTGPKLEAAMVFQSFGLLPWKTVRDNVAFPLRIRKLPEAEIRHRCDHYLELVGLTKFDRHYPHQLSGGMQQRVGLARALATEPQVLLMDEPFGAIDALQRELMQEELLRMWWGTKKTVVFVTHDIDEAIFLSDRVVVFTPHPGRIRAEIPIDLPHPRWEYDARGHEKAVAARRAIWALLRGHLVQDVRGEGAGERQAALSSSYEPESAKS